MLKAMQNNQGNPNYGKTKKRLSKLKPLMRMRGLHKWLTVNR